MVIIVIKIMYIFLEGVESEYCVLIVDNGLKYVKYF